MTAERLLKVWLIRNVNVLAQTVSENWKTHDEKHLPAHADAEIQDDGFLNCQNDIFRVYF